MTALLGARRGSAGVPGPKAHPASGAHSPTWGLAPNLDLDSEWGPQARREKPVRVLRKEQTAGGTFLHR